MPQALESRQPRATDRGLALLSAIGAHPQGLSLAEASRLVDLPASTALRHLRSLESAGFATKTQDGSYRPGAELHRIAATVMASDLPQRAQPILDALAQSLGETAYLAVPGTDSFAIYRATSPGTHTLRHASWLGAQVPRKGTAVGEALADRVNDDGVICVADAVEPGVTATAAPVFGADGAVIAAVCVVGPSFRLSGKLLARARAEIGAHARALNLPARAAS